MRLLDKRIGLIYSMISIVSAILSLFSSEISDIAIGSVVQIITFTVFYLIVSRSLLRFDYVFVVFLFFVHLPQYIVHGFEINIELIGWFDISKMASDDLIVEVGKYCILIVQGSMLGIIWARLICSNFMNKRIRIKPLNLSLDNVSLKRAKMVGFALIIIGVLPSLYLDISRLVYYLHGGYQATHTFPFARSGVMNYLSLLFKYGVMLLILAYGKDRKVSLILLLFGSLYLFISMLSGNRIMAIMFLVSFIILYNISKSALQKASAKKLILRVTILLLSLYVILLFINYVNASRSKEPFNIANAIVSPISYAVKTLSISISTVVHAFRFFPAQGTIGYGVTYFSSWLTVLPNIGDFLGSFDQYNIFTLNIPEPFLANLGGSFIGELYYNFRNLGVLASMMIGLGIGITSISIEKRVADNQYVSALALLSAMPFILQWPRAYFAEIIRPFVWTTLLLHLLVFISKKYWRST